MLVMRNPARCPGRLLTLLLPALLVLGCADQAAPEDETAADTAAVEADTTSDEAMGGGGAALALARTEPYGAYLADGTGRALYLFTADSQGGRSTCYDACAEAWPPLLVDGLPSAGDGVDSTLVDTLVRNDGSSQVTYGGWPLYYYRQDAGAGEVTGQDVHGFGGEWYLVGSDGAKIEETDEVEDDG